MIPPAPQATFVVSPHSKGQIGQPNSDNPLSGTVYHTGDRTSTPSRLLPDFVLEALSGYPLVTIATTGFLVGVTFASATGLGFYAGRRMFISGSGRYSSQGLPGKNIAPGPAPARRVDSHLHHQPEIQKSGSGRWWDQKQRDYSPSLKERIPGGEEGEARPVIRQRKLELEGSSRVTSIDSAGSLLHNQSEGDEKVPRPDRDPGLSPEYPHLQDILRRSHRAGPAAYKANMTASVSQAQMTALSRELANFTQEVERLRATLQEASKKYTAEASAPKAPEPASKEEAPLLDRQAGGSSVLVSEAMVDSDSHIFTKDDITKGMRELAASYSAEGTAELPQPDKPIEGGSSSVVAPNALAPVASAATGDQQAALTETDTGASSPRDTPHSPGHVSQDQHPAPLSPKSKRAIPLPQDTKYPDPSPNPSPHHNRARARFTSGTTFRVINHDLGSIVLAQWVEVPIEITAATPARLPVGWRGRDNNNSNRLVSLVFIQLVAACLPASNSVYRPAEDSNTNLVRAHLWLYDGDQVEGIDVAQIDGVVWRVRRSQGGVFQVRERVEL